MARSRGYGSALVSCEQAPREAAHQGERRAHVWEHVVHEGQPVPAPGGARRDVVQHHRAPVLAGNPPENGARVTAASAFKRRYEMSTLGVYGRGPPAVPAHARSLPIDRRAAASQPCHRPALRPSPSPRALGAPASPVRCRLSRSRFASVESSTNRACKVRGSPPQPPMRSVPKWNPSRYRHLCGQDIERRAGGPAVAGGNPAQQPAPRTGRGPAYGATRACRRGRAARATYHERSTPANGSRTC